MSNDKSASHSPDRGIRMELVSILRRIYASEIDVTLRSRWNMGWQVEIENGQVARAVVSSIDEAAMWLHEKMLVHYPDSLYAQTARGEIHQALANDDIVRPLKGT